MADSTQEAFGSAVRARRAELGLTLEQLAHASGISAGALSRIERGAISTSLHNAIAIAASLGSEVGDLVGRPAVSAVRQVEDMEVVDTRTGVRRALLARPAAGIELIRYVIPGQAATPTFAPHRALVREVFHIVVGRVTVEGEGAADLVLSAGDIVETPGDRRHRITNPGATDAHVLILMVTPR